MTIKEEMEKMIRRKLEKDNNFESFSKEKYRKQSLQDDIDEYEQYLRDKKNKEVDEIITQLKKEKNII